jgi:hypothetical protein
VVNVSVDEVRGDLVTPDLTEPALQPPLHGQSRAGLIGALHVGSALLGAALLAFAALLRSSPGFASISNGQILLKLGRAGPGGWSVIPLPSLLIGALILLTMLFVVAATGRNVRPRKTGTPPEAGRKIGTPPEAGSVPIFPRSASVGLVLVVLLLVLTLWPPLHDTDWSLRFGQEDVAFLTLGTLGMVFLLIGLSPVAEFVAWPARRAYRFLMNVPAPALAAGAALFVFVVTNLISWFVFHHLPHTYDTATQLFQARLFTHGRLYATMPSLPQFHDLMNGSIGDRLYNIQPPGHALVLALGLLAGLPWLVNPLLGALSVVLIYQTGRELYDEAVARVAALLAALSPFLLFMSGEFMNHASSLFFTSLLLLCHVRAVGRTGAAGVRYGLLAGLALGMTILVRPFTALLVAIPFALDYGWRLLRESRRYLARCAVMAAGAALLLGVYLLYSFLTTGDPFASAYALRWGPSHAVGLGSGIFGPALTFVRAVRLTQVDLNALNRYLFEFPIPSLLATALAFAAVSRNPWDYRLAAIPFALVAGHFFWWEHGLELFGPRREYEALGVFVLLSARGLQSLPAFIRERLGLAVSPERIRTVTLELLELCYVSVVLISVPALIGRYSTLFVLSGRTTRTVSRAKLEHAVVVTPRYDEVAWLNNQSLDGNVVFARDLGSLNPLLMRRYSDRRFYYADYDTLIELSDIGRDHAAIEDDLAQVAAALNRADAHSYLSLLLPFAELTETRGSAQGASSLPVFDYRALGQRLVVAPERFQELIPALAVWVRGDRSLTLSVFQAMDEGRNLLAGNLRYTRLGGSNDGQVLIYDIRRARDPFPGPLK